MIAPLRLSLSWCWVLALAVHPAPAAEPIKIAEIDPMSGPFSNIGMSAVHALQAEFDRINASGGALGRLFVIVPFDNDALARDPDVKRVYVINQDYVWGHSVAKDAEEMLAARRPDIRIVGSDLHPIGKVKDFAPYIAKVKAANADAIVTGNWGNDLALLIKAAKDAGLQADIYAPLAGLQGTPTMIGESGVDRVRAAVFWHENIEPNPLIDFALAYRLKYNEDWVWLPSYLLPQLLARAMTQARSDDPMKVALALENMRFAGPTGEVWMRPEDHQLMMPLFQTVFKRAGRPGVKYDAERTGFGWKTEGKVDTMANVPPLLCRVKRP